MSRNSAGFEIGRFTGRCAATGEVLPVGSPCIAVLCDREADEGFDRFDYSPRAWESGTRPERLYSYWRTIVPEPTRTRRMLVDDDVLLDLFQRLETDDRPQRQAFRFVLGLALIRKRLLKCVGREEDGGMEHWLITQKGDPQEQIPMKLLNPKLVEDDVQSLADQLGAVLSGDLS